ncbi:hypothetical protein L9F63_017766 [Diploptera punctata]|uniref:Uncharacterized protein n=1 Tax=Diploptera punctata TaxID=6984 RepID=A0AAD7ZY97_DIPPU|nr:hypothetical protein L9F63_017766 [Diploptera punctata]
MGSASIVFNLLLICFALIAADDHFDDEKPPDASQKGYQGSELDDVDEVYDTLKGLVVRATVISLIILALIVALLLVVILCCFKCSFCPAYRNVDRPPSGIFTPHIDRLQQPIIVIPNSSMYENDERNIVQAPPYWQPADNSNFSANTKPPIYQPLPTDERQSHVHEISYFKRA